MISPFVGMIAFTCAELLDGLQCSLLLYWFVTICYLHRSGAANAVAAGPSARVTSVQTAYLVAFQFWGYLPRAVHHCLACGSVTHLTCLARFYRLAPSCKHELLNAFDLAHLACIAVTLKLSKYCCTSYMSIYLFGCLEALQFVTDSWLQLADGHVWLHSLDLDCICWSSQVIIRGAAV